MSGISDFNKPGEEEVTMTVQDEKEASVAMTQHNENLVQFRSNLKTTTFMVIFSFWIAISGCMVNFDLGYGGTVLQMESFRRTFGECSVERSPATGRLVEKCHLTAVAQSMVSLSAIFTAIGGALSGIIGKYLGRRGTIQFGCAIIIIGAAGQCGTAGSYVAYNVCKCISCIGVGNLNAGSPLYGTESTSPQKRGALVSIYSIGLATGTLVSACICYGTSTIGTNWEWRTPVLLQIPLALLYALGLASFPESPRWLMTKGREEAARKSFGRFYNKDPYSDEITAQVNEVRMYIEFEKSISSTASWTELFHRSYVRRTFTSMLVAAITPLSGITLVGNYAAVFFAANGVSKPFLIQIYVGVCGLTGSFCGPGLVEYVGRRLTSLFGFGFMACCMLIFSVTASALGSSTETARNTLIAFLCIWFFLYASCVSSTHWLIGAEVHSVRLRGYGQAVSVATANIFTFAATFFTPYMINPAAGNMGTNVGYFYLALDVVGFALLFMFLPETARLSLEQIDDLFASGRKAWKTSISRNKKIAKGELFDVAPDAHKESRDKAVATHLETTS